MQFEINKDKVLIVDFGSQVTKLIARNIRELNVYCEIIPYNSSLEKIKSMNPDCLILSGSPASIYDKKPPLFDERILDDKLPILGICYGAQLISKIFKSNVKKSKSIWWVSFLSKTIADFDTKGYQQGRLVQGCSKKCNACMGKLWK